MKWGRSGLLTVWSPRGGAWRAATFHHTMAQAAISFLRKNITSRHNSAAGARRAAGRVCADQPIFFGGGGGVHNTTSSAGALSSASEYSSQRSSEGMRRTLIDLPLM